MHLPGSFGGRLVVGFESRRAAEMASLIERHGGAAVSAPSLREVTLEQPGAALPFAEALGGRSGRCSIGRRVAVQEYGAPNVELVEAWGSARPRGRVGAKPLGNGPLALILIRSRRSPTSR
jgi:uroporphyrinogen-III synthase